jgi:hypothetical protein
MSMKKKKKKSSMSQRPPAAEWDMALLYLSFLFDKLLNAPKRNCAMLDALAWQILHEDPKTPLGLALSARAEMWLRRHLWMLDFDSLSPSDRAARLVIDSAMRLAAHESRGAESCNYSMVANLNEALQS